LGIEIYVSNIAIYFIFLSQYCVQKCLVWRGPQFINLAGRVEMTKQTIRHKECHLANSEDAKLRIYKFVCVHQCFSTFFGSRHPVRLKKIWRHPFLAKLTICGTFTSKKFKKVVNSIFGSTPDTSSRHPCVPRHPGWEPLVYTFIMTCCKVSK